MKLCERHSRLRCGECAYVEELKQDNQDLADKYNNDIYALEAKVEEMQKAFEAIHVIASETFESHNQLELIRLKAVEHLKGGETK